MDAQPRPPLLSRFRQIMHRMGEAFALRGRNDSILGPALLPALHVLVTLRLAYLQRRLIVLIERTQAGTLRPLRIRPADAQSEAGGGAGAGGEVKAEAEQPGTRKPRARKPADAAHPAEAGVAFKQIWGWGREVGRHHASVCMADFEEFLRDPRLQEMIANDPARFGRAIRPLCRMFGICEMPDLIRQPWQNHVTTIDQEEVERRFAEDTARAAAGQPPLRVEPQGIVCGTNGKPRKQPLYRFYITAIGRARELAKSLLPGALVPPPLLE